MALIFRKYFWLVNGAFILCVAMFGATTANLFVEQALAPPLTGMETSRAHASETREEARTPIDGERLAKLTGLTFGKDEPTVVEPKPDEVATGPVRSSLRVKLLGTLVASNAQWSFASVQDLETQRAKSLMVGDELMGAKVLSIERERIIVAANNREEFIDGEASPGMSAAPTLARTVPGASSGAENGVRATGENSYEISDKEFTNAVANPDQLLTQARAIPAMENGQPVGFKLFSIKPNSLYSKIGLQNGDVLKRINGLSIDSVERALEAFTKLREARHIEVDIGRGGGSVRKVYDVR
ncbi:general secretion pathway protein GspC [Pyxidicoccus parkwayensis]|uniref:General secretion pathway protein GspC n=1 Tax=Pyxidicoccus parkwayensis TaxID=2813578 RepID=A0ABX7P8X2_9BACT|nr:type II secretion system protein GspC [Pyxidicoccus parkwaysis]QSQ26902.1 general secretion pathway protein GspC [Pyxidicoccus parkwaysis]